MADLYTLSLSPPALGDPPDAAPSTVPSSSSAPPGPESKEGPKPKSFLFNDTSLTVNIPAGQVMGSGSAPQPPVSPSKPAADPLLPSLVHVATSENEESVGKDAETGVSVTVRDPPAAELFSVKAETLIQSSGPATPREEQQESLSPDLTPGPNLYPSVHVTHNPSPVRDDGHLTASQLQSPGCDVTPASPVSARAAAAPEQKSLEPSQQAQNPPSLPPPLSPTPGSPCVGTEELPNTPTRAVHSSPAVPVIQEPDLVLPLPTSRPAPDTLSYLESASLMSGTLESLSGLGEDGSSVGSDSEINGMAVRRTDRYGFLGGNQYSDSRCV